jgi:hypothetical protein
MIAADEDWLGLGLMYPDNVPIRISMMRGFPDSWRGRYGPRQPKVCVIEGCWRCPK